MTQGTKPETRLQAGIVKALQALGYWVIRTGVKGKRSARGARTGEPGMPDLYLPGLGHLEVKMPGEDLQPHQRAWFERARRAGVHCACVHSVDEAVSVVQAWALLRNCHLGQGQLERRAPSMPAGCQVHSEHPEETRR